MVWISGPGGAGKTTLLSSYIDARALPCIWYQIDERDADPATFFYYLSTAVKTFAPRYRKPLPLLTPEYAQSLPTFTRRYFEELFRRLKTPGVVVFDNFQEIPADSGFHEMLLHALDSIPYGANVILLSRNDCPAPFSRLLANGKIGHLGWNEMRFTLEESAELLRSQNHCEFSDDYLSLLHKKTDGWAAGLVIAMNGSKETTAGHGELADLGSGAIFDYFANEIFERSAEPVQDFLLKTCFLERMTLAHAEELSGNHSAEAILERLYREHFFTQKHLQDKANYQYHPLFRDFLQARAKRTFPLSDIAAIQSRAARLLAESGQIEEAAGLFISASDWDGLAQLVLAQAENLLSCGRIRTLSDWIEQLPSSRIETDPWLQYWQGMCLLPFDPRHSRAVLEGAFSLFRTRSEQAGALVTWAGIVDSYMYEWHDFKPLDQWIAILEEMLGEDRGFPSPEIEARVAAGMFIALSWRQPTHPRIDYWEDKVFQTMIGCPHPQLKMMLANHLLIHHLWSGEFAKTSVIIDAVRPSSRAAENAPLTQMTWWVMEAMQSWFAADHWTCLMAITEGNRLAETSGVHLLDVYLNAQGVYSGVSLGDPDTAHACLRIMAEANSLRPMDRSLFHYMSSQVAWLDGDLYSAEKHGQIAVDLARATHSTLAISLCEIELATVLFDLGRHEQADHYLACALRSSEGRSCMRFLHHLHAARFAFERAQEDEGLEQLRAAMAIGARQGYVNIPRWNPRTMQLLCSRALAAGIETEYVQRLTLLHEPLPAGPRTATAGAGDRDDARLPPDRLARKRTLQHQAQEVEEINRRLHREALEKDAKIRELQSAKEKMEALAITDPLTGLYNRHHFNEAVPQEYKRALRNELMFMFIIIDVDNFKRYNDTYGHPAGDSALVRIAQALRGSLRRSGDMVFRLGGEEFGVISSCKSTEVEALPERLRRAVFDLEIPHEGNPPHARVTISAGCTICANGHSCLVDELYCSADAALYRANANGRNTFVLTMQGNTP